MSHNPRGTTVSIDSKLDMRRTDSADDSSVAGIGPFVLALLSINSRRARRADIESTKSNLGSEQCAASYSSIF